MSRPRFSRVYANLLAGAVGVAVFSVPPPDAPCAPPDSAAQADQARLDSLWLDLEKGEIPATRAVLQLSSRPEEAVAFLKKKVRPLKIDEEQVKALLEWLGSEDETIWKPAYEQLEYLDPRLAIDIVELMRDVKETPARQRMVEIMSGHEIGTLKGKDVRLRSTRNSESNFFDGTMSWWAEAKVSQLNSSAWAGDKKKWTRAVRAIVLLEFLGTPDAIAVLNDMATGHPEAQPTIAAAEAVKRLTAKATGKP